MKYNIVIGVKINSNNYSSRYVQEILERNFLIICDVKMSEDLCQSIFKN